FFVVDVLASVAVVFSPSLHDALPIWVQVLSVVLALFFQDKREPWIVLGVYCHDRGARRGCVAIELLRHPAVSPLWVVDDDEFRVDRKSTRLNSSHVKISYAVFCWNKK